MRTFDQWFQKQQGIPYDSSYLFAKAAWESQAAEIAELRLIIVTDTGTESAVSKLQDEIAELRLQSISDSGEVLTAFAERDKWKSLANVMADALERHQDLTRPLDSTSDALDAWKARK